MDGWTREDGLSDFSVGCLADANSKGRRMKKTMIVWMRAIGGWRIDEVVDGGEDVGEGWNRSVGRRDISEVEDIDYRGMKKKKSS